MKEVLIPQSCAIDFFVERGGHMAEQNGVIINRDRQLILPDNLEIHPEDQMPMRATGTFASGPGSMIQTYTDEGQRDHAPIMTGLALMPILVGKGLLVERATTLRQYTDKPDSIPREMRDGRRFTAWGDIARDRHRHLHVCVFFWDGQPHVEWGLVGGHFSARYTALLAHQD